MECPECKKQIPDDVASCSECGYPFKPVKPGNSLIAAFWKLIKQEVSRIREGLRLLLQRWRLRREKKKVRKQEMLAKEQKFRDTHFPCPTCGYWSRDEASICRNCGRPFDDDEALTEFLLRREQMFSQEDNTEVKTSETKRIRKSLGCLVALIFLIAFLAFVFFVPLRACPSCNSFSRAVMNCPYCGDDKQQTLFEIWKASLRNN